jgi:hypothetical protein
VARVLQGYETDFKSKEPRAMNKNKSVCVADLVMAAYDEAGRMTQDQRATSVLAACAVRQLLLKAGRPDLARELSKKGA